MSPLTGQGVEGGRGRLELFWPNTSFRSCRVGWKHFNLNASFGFDRFRPLFEDSLGQCFRAIHCSLIRLRISFF